jgi:ATP-binding cassette subfamily B protein
MILKYYGKKISPYELRKSCNTEKDGVSILDIADAANLYKLKTVSGYFKIDELKDEHFPCILYWAQNHFVVLYKIQNRKGVRTFFIAEPSRGLLKLTEKEFSDNWLCVERSDSRKGIVLLLKPTKEFDQVKNDNSKNFSTTFILSYIRKYKQLIIQLVVGLLIGCLLQLILPFLTQLIVDIGISNNDLNFIYLILIGQFLLLIGRGSVEFIRRWILLHISARINILLLSDFVSKLLRVPLGFFDSKQVGDILQRIYDHERIENFITSQSLNTLFSLFSVAVFSVVLFYYNFIIFLVFMAGVILYIFWVTIFLQKRKTIDYDFFAKRATNHNILIQIIHGSQEIRLQNCEERRRFEWQKSLYELFKVNVLNLKYQQIQEAGNLLINESKNIIITICSAQLVINHSISLGEMLAIQFIIGQLNYPVTQFMTFIYNWQDVRISIERLNEIHNKEEENNKDKVNSNPLNRSISIDNLQFRYGSRMSAKVIDGLSLYIPENKITAIVGSSGSGKTTLIKLMLGFYSKYEGEIIIGKQELSGYDLNWWRKNCGVVMQDGYIFSESIAQNIAAGDTHIDYDRLNYAIKVANMEESINSLPLKQNTLLGQEGQNLSQGQKQRLFIARCVYKNPPFLFFDEATNALDANNEKIIVENLSDFYKGKTVVVVAHRLSTVKNADNIVVLEHGKIVESGNHETLVALKGYYYKLIKNQLELGS